MLSASLDTEFDLVQSLTSPTTFFFSVILPVALHTMNLISHPGCLHSIFMYGLND
jgi:hypothetical protein